MGDLKSAKGPKPVEQSPARHRASPSAGSVSFEMLPEAYDAAGNGALARLIASGTLRRRVSISQPDDPHEREADAVADRFMASTAAANPVTIGAATGLFRTCACGGSVPCGCEADGLDAIVHRRAERRGNATGHVDADAHHVVSRMGPGRPLDSGVRARFESGLQRDLGDVRIHTSTDADRAARAVQAHAFAIGHDIAFARGRYSPETREGQHLIAHELAHVVQQDIGAAVPALQREPAKPGQDAGPAPPVVHQWPTTGVWIDLPGGIHLTEHPDQLREQMLLLIAKGQQGGGLMAIPPGINAPSQMLGRLLFLPVDCSGYSDMEECVENAPRLKIYRALEPVVANLLAEHKAFLNQFESAARQAALTTLDANEQEAMKEAARYGIRTEYIAHVPPPVAGVSDAPTSSDPMDAGVGAPPGTVVTYERKVSMGDDPAAKGLQGAAEVLLKRRRQIEDKKEEQQRHYLDEQDSEMGGGEDSDYVGLGQEVERLTREYEELREMLGSQYPVLDRFADLDRGKGGLEELSRGPSPEMAALIADRIESTLGDIARSRRGLAPDSDDVNVWRLDPIVQLTKAGLGVDQDLVKTVLVDEKVRDEKPGILEGIALAVMNIGALLLSPVTGGLSLAVAFGVNAAVAYGHVQDYLIGKALAGSSLRKATALSREDPSLFWLAVEIAGLALDAATMVQTFRTLGPLAKAAMAAKGTKEAEEAIIVLEQAAKDVPQGAELGARLAGKVRSLTAGEEFADALKASKLVSSDEVTTLTRAGEAVRAEAAGEALGKAAVQGVGGEVKVSRAGHLFSCASPCVMLREKYAEVLSNNRVLEKELQQLEDLAKAAKGSEEADAIATRAAGLESRLRIEPVGEFTSPLKSDPSVNFEDVLKRRGSAAEKLDRHPPNWTGTDEARFRGLPEPGDGYRWRLDAEGNLSVGPIRQSKTLPRKIYDPVAQEFKDVGDNVSRAKLLNPAETKTLALSDAERSEINKILADRKALLDKRDALEQLEQARSLEGKTLTKAEADELSKLRGGINKQSEMLGERAAETYVKGQFPGIGPPVYRGSGAGRFDLIYKWKDAGGNDIFIVVEAKGGSSGLGTRQLATGVTAEQGTGEYLDDIAQAMVGRRETLGVDLQLAKAQGRVKYLKVQAPINSDPGAIVRVGEFDIGSTSQAAAATP
jgi:hypothetical protein